MEHPNCSREEWIALKAQRGAEQIAWNRALEPKPKEINTADTCSTTQEPLSIKQDLLSTRPLHGKTELLDVSDRLERPTFSKGIVLTRNQIPSLKNVGIGASGLRKVIEFVEDHTNKRLQPADLLCDIVKYSSEGAKFSHGFIKYKDYEISVYTYDRGLVKGIRTGILNHSWSDRLTGLIFGDRFLGVINQEGLREFIMGKVIIINDSAYELWIDSSYDPSNLSPSLIGQILRFCEGMPPSVLNKYFADNFPTHIQTNKDEIYVFTAKNGVKLEIPATQIKKYCNFTTSAQPDFSLSEMAAEYIQESLNNGAFDDVPDFNPIELVQFLNMIKYLGINFTKM